MKNGCPETDTKTSPPFCDQNVEEWIKRHLNGQTEVGREVYKIIEDEEEIQRSKEQGKGKDEYLGRIILYPYGALSRQMLNVFTFAKNIDFVGVADQNAQAINKEKNLSLWSLEDLKDRQNEYDSIFVCHEYLEMEISHSLIKEGIPENKLIKYQSSSIWQKLVDQLFNRILNCGIDNLICIGPDGAHVLSQDDITSLYPKENTIILTSKHAKFDRDAYEQKGYQVHPILDLVLALETPLISGPKIVHFQGTAANSIQAYKIRTACKDSYFIYEPYDLYAYSFTTEDLYEFSEKVFNIPPDQTKAHILAEDFLLRTSDLIVSKFSADENPFKDLAAKGRFLSYFPQLSDREPTSPLPETNKKLENVIYASFIPTNEQLDEFPSFTYAYGNIDLFNRLSKIQEIEFSIYNSGDIGNAESTQRYKEVVASICSPKLHYFSKKNIEEIEKIISDFDAGWQCHNYFKAPAIPGAQNTVIQNTTCVYLSAGTPVIISSDMKVLSKLVLEFNAGIVLESLDLEYVVKRLNEFNPREMKIGARKLRTHLKKHNYSQIEYIQNQIAKILRPD